MKRLIGFTAVLVVLFLSNSVFAEDLTFEVNGKKYEAEKSDLPGYYNWADAKAGCDRLVTEDTNDDWFLPSKDELNAMYEQLHKKAVGGFANFYYWSSSENVSNYAWGQDFYNGYLYGNHRVDRNYVRCIRAL